MNKLMCRFVATTKKKKKIADPNLDTACPAGIPCNYVCRDCFLFSYLCYNIIMAAGVLLPPQRTIDCEGMETVFTELLRVLWRDETIDRKHGKIRGNLTWPEQRECQHKGIA